MDITPLEVIQSFVARLLARHREIQQHQDEDLSLVYANGLLTHQLLRKDFPELPPQIVVIGPTQAGKSTITNLLVGAQVAKSSALAGFTRHAGGYLAQPLDEQIIKACDVLLPGLNSSNRDELSNNKLDSFSLHSEQNAQAIRQPLMVWDTPDFDSVSSCSYRSTVPMLCAIADLIVLVVSKDKYADQTVWEALRLIARINRPLLVCINKVPATAKSKILRVVENKFLDEKIATAAITTLPYLPEENFASLLKHADTRQFRELVDANLQAGSGEQSPALLKQFLMHHWSDWTMALNNEGMARRQWEKIIHSAIKETTAAYERDYLRNPDYGDTIQRAIARLLELLEIPAIAAALARTRKVITWPARRLIEFIKKQPGGSAKNAATDNETQVINDILSHLLMQLQRTAGEHAATAPDDVRLWWQQLWQNLQAQAAALTESGRESTRAHQVSFEPHIETSAQHLFEHLQQHPTTLNGLRAARVSTDAAAVVLALKTGGIGLSDLILAPAMLSFSTLLAEGAVGRYMKGIEEDLKIKQLKSVNEHILTPMQQRLMNVPAEMKNAGLYGLPRKELDAANNALEQPTFLTGRAG